MSLGQMKKLGVKTGSKTIVSEFEKSRDFYAAALHGGIPDGQEHEILSGRD
jgi:hypothetical protein